MSRLLIVLSLLAGSILNAEANSQKDTKLTLKQVLALVAAAPDQVAANEIRQHGVAVPVSRNDVERVQKAGGGPRTLEALRQLIVMPVLVVQSNQDQSEVLLDGTPKGSAGPARPLTIRDADRGPHTVVVRKPRYSTAELPVTLTAGRTTEISANLESTMATLSVVTNPPNARVDIEGVDLAGRSPSNLDLAPGSYVIHVTAPRFTEATQQVTLKAGEIRQLDVPMQIDPAYARTLVAQSQNELAAGHYSSAFKLAANGLTIDPSNSQAMSVEAMCAFYVGQYPMFVQDGLRAIQSGAELDIPLMHHHALRASHLAFIKVERNKIAYEPNVQPGAGCNTAAFQVPFSDLRSVEVKQDTRGQRYLELRLAGPGLAKSQTFVFADYRSHIQSQGNGLSFLVSPPNGPEEITSTGSLLQSLLQSSRP